jgi:hypothetical protein
MRTASLTVAAALFLPACALPGLADLAQPGFGLLPPLDVVVLPSPGRDGFGPIRQAACAEGSATYDAVQALIDEQNAALDADVALFRALYDASPSFEAGTSRFTAEVDGVQLIVDVVSLPGTARTYEGVLVTADGVEHEYLDGAVLDDESAGSLTITPPDGDEVEIAWYRPTPDTLDLSRDVGASSAVLMKDEEFVRLAIGPVSSVWKLSTGAGVAVSDDEESVACWSAGEQAGDFCDAPCTQELIEQTLDGADVVTE